MKHCIPTFVALQLLLSLICCQSMSNPISKEDKQILNRFWQYAEKLQLAQLPTQERIPLIACFFLDTPYEGNTLNIHSKERLVINLRALDCVTFVENVLALALLPEYHPDYESKFLENLQKIRYRQGKIENYCSRLHYSSDWLYDLKQRDILQDVTRQAGGVPFQPHVFYMSKHYNRYPQLKNDTVLVQEIQKIEKTINQRSLHYIPKAEVEQAYGQIKHGDVLLITTHLKGLDTSHLGFAYKKEGVVYLLHASSTSKKVILSSQSLEAYMAPIKSQSGIMIGRIVPHHSE